MALGIIGLFMMYTMGHSVAIIFKKIEGVTKYERFVLWFALVSTTLVVIGVTFGE